VLRSCANITIPKLLKFTVLVCEESEGERDGFCYPIYLLFYFFILIVMVVVPYLAESHRKKALTRIAFLQECLCMSKTPGSFIHRGKLDERLPSSPLFSECIFIYFYSSDENTTFGSNNSISEDENESYQRYYRRPHVLN
jgi:hypothetical protein